MEKSCQSSLTGDSSAANNGGSTVSTGRDQYLKHLNKLSHKISKPSFVKKPGFDSSIHSNPNFNQNQNLSQPPPPLPPPPPESAVQAQTQQPPQHHQPPVYNINKNDFRDVVQKLTGSPAHERFSNPPPIHPPKPQSSRLQRIRPPPLANVSNRPPPMLNSALPIPQPQQPPPGMNPRNSISSANNFGPIGRPLAPLSPLPPLPAVHAPAESPVSAYMRYLHNSFSTFDSNQKQFSGFSPLAPLVSPRWNNLNSQQQLPPPAMPQGAIPPPPSSAVMASELQFPMPPSPLPFGCMNSPRSAYPLLSPSLLFSPSSGPLGYPQFPLSPTVPVPSPRWRGL